MSKSILLAAVLMVSVANAQETQFKWSGGLEVKYESTGNYDHNDSASDRENDFVQTTRLALDIVRSENLFGKIVLRNVALWGDVQAITGSETAYKTQTQTSNLLLVEEAYGVWKMNDVSTLQFGRGSFELANGELVSRAGNGGYTPISFDGALLSNEFDALRFSVFGVRAVDESFNATEGATAVVVGNSDAHFLGGVVDLKNIPEFLNKVNIHYVLAKANSATTNEVAQPIVKNDRQWIGLSVGGEMGAFDYAAAYENFTGNITFGGVERDREGDMFNVEAGFNMPEVKGLRIGVAYHQSSGDKDGGATTTDSKAYDSFNYDQEKYTGRMGIARWGNGLAGTNALVGTGLTAMAVKVKMVPMDDLTVMLDYYMFTETEKSGTDDEIGNEIDLTIQKKYANGFKTSLEYGMFMPGDDVVGGGDDSAERIMASAGFDF